MRAGASASVTLAVTEADTAIALASGEVPVLSTPRVLALIEQAAVDAVRDQIPDGQTSVGARVELDHLRPTRIGATVTATATLVAVDGHRLHFTATVTEGDIEVARALHRRAIVDRARFT